MRKNISTNTPSEERVGYSRAVRINNRIYVSGTTSVDEAGTVVGSNVEGQSRYIFQKIAGVLEGEGFSKNDIVQVTAFLIDMENLPEFDRAFSESLGNVRPACTLVGVKELVDPRLLIEIECIAEQAGFEVQ